MFGLLSYRTSCLSAFSPAPHSFSQPSFWVGKVPRELSSEKSFPTKTAGSSASETENHLKGCVQAGLPSVPSGESAPAETLAPVPGRRASRYFCHFTDLCETIWGLQGLQLDQSRPGTPISRCRWGSEKAAATFSFYFLLIV